MVPAIFGLVGVVVGALVTSLSEWLRHRSETRLAASRERRGRLEELYETLDEYERAFSDMLVSLTFALASKEGGELPTPSEIPSSRLRMLVDLYAPELKSQRRKGMVSR